MFSARVFLLVFSCSRFLARSSRSSLRLSMSFCSHVCPRALTFTRFCLWVIRDIIGYMMRAWCTRCASRKYVGMDVGRVVRAAVLCPDCPMERTSFLRMMDRFWLVGMIAGKSVVVVSSIDLFDLW